MRYLAALIGCLSVISLIDAAIFQRRTYRNAGEILVPVAIIQDGEEIKESAGIKPEAIAANVAPIVAEVKKLDALETVVQAQRRIDEAIVEEEIKEALQEEVNKEIVKGIEEANKLRTTTLADASQVAAAVQPAKLEAIKEPANEVVEAEKASNFKSVAAETPIPNQILLLVDPSNVAGIIEGGQLEGEVRQGTPATPVQITTPQNFVQQFLQNNPLGQFFNQITGQTSQVLSDGVTQNPLPGIPAFLNPITAAQSVYNSTAQAFQGFQQFASNIGTQFQSTLSGFAGQQQLDASGSTVRPPGPIQQLVGTFIPQQGQNVSTQQGPLQGLLYIFQGNPGNRPQTAVATAPPAASETIVLEQAQAPIVAPTVTSDVVEPTNNEVRGSAEINDSFEDSISPGELIVVNDDNAKAQEVHQVKEVPSVPK